MSPRASSAHHVCEAQALGQQWLHPLTMRCHLSSSPDQVLQWILLKRRLAGHNAVKSSICLVYIMIYYVYNICIYIYIYIYLYVCIYIYIYVYKIYQNILNYVYHSRIITCFTNIGSQVTERQVTQDIFMA